MRSSILRESYDRIEPRATRLKRALCQEIIHLIETSDVTLGVPIESRVKEWASIQDKVARKSLNCGSVDELDDLVGIRLVLLFRRDIMEVDRLLRASLTIKSAEDTGLRLADTQFGYQSQHYIVEIPREWLNTPTWNDLGGIKVEIQVRTLAQHIWAAASHKLQYKHERSVPLPLRRSINRASALLETVDIEFDRLLDDRENYLIDISMGERQTDQLNVETVDVTLSSILPSRNKQEDEPYDDLLLDLEGFNIRTPEQLEHLLTKHIVDIMESDRQHAEKYERGSGAYFKQVGLVREALRLEFGSDEVSEFINQRELDSRQLKWGSND